MLEEQQLVLSFEEGAFWLHYFSRRLPIEPHSWAMILNQRIEELDARLGNENPHLLEYQSILTAISHLPARNETDPEKVSERRREKEVIKRRLAELADRFSRGQHFPRRRMWRSLTAQRGTAEF